LQLWPSQFSLSIEHIQRPKNSLVDSLIRELANDDHENRTLA